MEGTGPLCAQGPFQVAVSILPQKYFVERIGGRKVQVLSMIPPGASPALYEPSPRQMAALSRCRLYFTIGVPFEKAWVERFKNSNPHLSFIPIDRWVAKIPIEPKHHGGQRGLGTHSLDPHVWLSPPLVILQARVILDALCALAPGECQGFEKNYRKWIHELVDLDLELRQMFPPRMKARRFLVYHPSWGYFAATYGLEQVPMELEGKAPSPKQLARFVKYARKAGFTTIIVQPQFSRRAAELVAKQIGARVVAADPLAYRWEENLLKCARIIRQALSP